MEDYIHLYLLSQKGIELRRPVRHFLLDFNYYVPPKLSWAERRRNRFIYKVQCRIAFWRQVLVIFLRILGSLLALSIPFVLSMLLLAVTGIHGYGIGFLLGLVDFSCTLLLTTLIFHWTGLIQTNPEEIRIK